MTKQQKALASVLGLAVGVLLIDQVLPGPDGASAALTAPPAAPVAQAASEAPEPVEAAAPGIASFTDVLEHAAAQAGASLAPADADAFDTSAWQAPEADPVTQPEPEIDPVEQFLASHRLTSVIVGDSAAAIVDGELVRIGQEIGGFRLVHVASRAATFEGGSGQAVLELPEQR